MVDRWVLSRAVALGGSIALLAYFATELHHRRPLGDWAAVFLLVIWAWEALFVSACLCLGHWALERVFRLRELPRVESVAWSMALGVIGFVALLFACGAVGLFRPWVAVALPGVLVATNHRRVSRAFHAIWTAPPRLGLSGAGFAVAAAGWVALAGIYLGAMTPAAISCDAGWFHMSSAEDYVREGRLVPQIGDWAKTLPQLTAMLHTWAFLVPGMNTPQHWMLGLHTEFVLFVMTLLSVVVAVRWVLDTPDGHHLAWAAYFLFPSIFIDDSNLGGAADHVQAFFALPLLITALRAFERPDLRMAALAGTLAGGSFSTKIQALYVVLPLFVLLCARAAWAARPAEGRTGARRAALLGPWTFAASLIAAWSPQLVRNAVSHRNPFYPFLLGWFPHSYPTMPDASRLFFEHLAPVGSGPFLQSARHALETAFTFPFETYGPHAPQGVPFIGSVFTILLPVALLARRRRVLLSLLVSFGALFQWAYVFPVPRNLQTFLPLLVVVTAASLAELWSRGLVARAFAVLLVALQGSWGAAEASVSARGRIDDALALLETIVSGDGRKRLDEYFSGRRALDRGLPKNAVVLLHTTYAQLGINRRTLLDWPGFQGLIDYRPMRSPRDVCGRFRELGVTHVATSPEWPAHSRQEEALVDAFLARYGRSRGPMGEFVLWAMPPRCPPDTPPFRVASFQMPGYEDGLYAVERMTSLDDGPRPARKRADVPAGAAAAASILPEADVVFVAKEVELPAGVLKTLAVGYTVVAAYPDYHVYLRSLR